jgi:hypothetical protein
MHREPDLAHVATQLTATHTDPDLTEQFRMRPDPKLELNAMVADMRWLHEVINLVAVELMQDRLSLLTAGFPLRATLQDHAAFPLRSSPQTCPPRTGAPAASRWRPYNSSASATRWWKRWSAFKVAQLWCSWRCSCCWPTAWSELAVTLVNDAPVLVAAELAVYDPVLLTGDLLSARTRELNLQYTNEDTPLLLRPIVIRDVDENDQAVFVKVEVRVTPSPWSGCSPSSRSPSPRGTAAWGGSWSKERGRETAC